MLSMRQSYANTETPVFMEKMHRTETFSAYDNPCIDLYSVQICNPPVLPLSNLANFSSPPPILLQTPKSPVDDQTIYVAKILAYLPQLHHQQRQKSPHHNRSPYFQSGAPKIITAEEARLAQQITAQLATAGVQSPPGARIPVDPEFFRNNHVSLPLHPDSTDPTTEPRSLLSKFGEMEPGKFAGQDFSDNMRKCDQKLDALEIKTEPIWDFHKTRLRESFRRFVPLLQAKRGFEDYDKSKHDEIYKMPSLQDMNAAAIKITSPEVSPQNFIINGSDQQIGNSCYNNSPSPQSYLSPSPENTSSVSSLAGGSDSGIESLPSHNTFSLSPYNESELIAPSPHLASIEMSEKRRKTMSTSDGGILLPPKKRKYTDAVATESQNITESTSPQDKSKKPQPEKEPTRQSNPITRSAKIPAPPALERIAHDNYPKMQTTLPPRPALIVVNPLAKSSPSEAKPAESIKSSLNSPHHHLTPDDTERSKVKMNRIAGMTAAEFSPKSSLTLPPSPRENIIIKNNNHSLHKLGYHSAESPISSTTFSPLSSASVSPAPLKAAENSSYNQGWLLRLLYLKHCTLSMNKN